MITQEYWINVFEVADKETADSFLAKGIPPYDTERACVTIESVYEQILEMRTEKSWRYVHTIHVRKVAAMERVGLIILHDAAEQWERQNEANARAEARHDASLRAGSEKL